MLLGVDTVFVKNPLPAMKMTKVDGLAEASPGDVTGTGTRFAFDYKGPDTAIAINRLLKDGAHVASTARRTSRSTGVARDEDRSRSRRTSGLTRQGRRTPNAERRTSNPTNAERASFHAPRVAMYQPWTGGNMDEGWTRWVLEQYEFNLTSIHNADIRAGKLRQKFDAIIIADQDPRAIVDGFDAPRDPAGVSRRHRRGRRRAT